MAFMSQERKAALAVEIAKVMPKAWKYTLKVRHHSTLVLTIRQANVDLIKENMVSQTRDGGKLDYISLNEYNLQGHYSDKLLKTFESIKVAMNIGNHDHSDVQSDYFNVGWYVDINIGAFQSPFRFVPNETKQAEKIIAQSGVPLPELVPSAEQRRKAIEATKAALKAAEREPGAELVYQCAKCDRKSISFHSTCPVCEGDMVPEAKLRAEKEELKRKIAELESKLGVKK